MKTALTIGIAAGIGLLAGIGLAGFWKQAPEKIAAEAAELSAHTNAEALPASKAMPMFASPDAHGASEPATAHGDSEAEHAQARLETSRKHEARWTSESSRPVQAVELERELQAAALSDGVIDARFQPEDLSVECRASMCRIESVFPKGADGGQWSTRMLLTANGKIGNAVIVPDRLPSGEYKQVIYAYRLGQTPPR